METREMLNQAVKDAMRAGDDLKRTTIRMALAAIKNAEIDSRTTLDDAQVLAILQKEVRLRREAIEEAQTANRPDLIAAAEQEIAVLETFLPQQMTEDEIRQLAAAVIAEVGAEGPRQMGDVMKVLMPRIQGRADGKLVSGVVRSLLQG